MFLEEQKAADASFPLGLPLAALAETTVPIDLSVSFSDLPGLADSFGGPSVDNRLRIVSTAPLASTLDASVSQFSVP